jgi:hypothetical protein
VKRTSRKAEEAMRASNGEVRVCRWRPPEPREAEPHSRVCGGAPAVPQPFESASRRQSDTTSAAGAILSARSGSQGRRDSELDNCPHLWWNRGS